MARTALPGAHGGSTNARKETVSLDLTTLRLLKHRARYENMARAVPRRALDTRTQIILSDFGRYFSEFPNAQTIDPDAFRVFFTAIHPKCSDEDHAVYNELLRQVMAEEVRPEVAEGMMKRLVETATAYDVAQLIAKYQEGDEVDLRAGLLGFLDSYDQQIDRKVKNPQVLDAIEDLLKAEANDTGLHWRLPCLNRHIKPLVGGDFVVVAARPDKGKTTFWTDQLTHMAAQVDTLWPGEKRSILWFNNEGPGKRIVTRCFQSALNATIEDLVKLSNIPADKEFAHYKTMVRQKYAEALGGRPGVLRIFDIHDMWNHEVEEVIALHRPAMVVFDMIDNIKFGGEASNNGQRTDQLLEAMYQWARLRGVKHDCAVAANSQISADGDGVQYPTLPQLKDSKTGKQGAADVIITLGAVNDPVLENSRYIGTTKNKKVRTGVKASPMQEVIFDGNRGRYVEMQ
jgi:replicative DNA helicase